MNTPLPPRQSFDPVALLPHADGTPLIASSRTVRVFEAPAAPGHRVLSTITARVVGGVLQMRFSAVPLPDRREQLLRTRRQRLQR